MARTGLIAMPDGFENGVLEVRGENGALGPSECHSRGQYDSVAGDQRSMPRSVWRTSARFTTDRDAANEENGPDLLGLDHPLVAEMLSAHRDTLPEHIGVAVAGGDGGTLGVITCWLINARMPKGEQRVFLQPIAVREDGQRMPPWERQLDRHLAETAAPSHWTELKRLERLRNQIEPALDRELGQRGVLSGDGAYTAELITWVELA